MQVLAVAAVALCVVLASGMSSYNYGRPSHYGQVAASNVGQYRENDYGNGGYGADEYQRRYGRYDNGAKAYNDAGNKYAAHGTNYHKAADHASAKGDAAANAYGHKDAAHGDKAYATAAHANKAGHYGDAAHKYAGKDTASKAAAHTDYANNNYYRKGDVYNSGVHYGFDKKYNKKSNDNGDYEIIDDSSNHNLDEYRDRNAASTKANRNHADSKHASDAAHALKDSKYAKGARQAHYDNGKYGAAASSVAKNGGAKHGYDSKLNEAAGSNKYYTNAHDAAANKYNDFAGKNAYYNQKHAGNAALKAANKYAGQGSYAKGDVGNGYGRGFGQKYADRLGHAAQQNGAYGAVNHVNYVDAAANAALANSGKYGSKLADYQRNKAGAGYHRNGYNNAGSNDYYKSGAAAAKNNKYHSEDDAAAAAKHGFSHAGADVASRYDNKAAVYDDVNSAFAKDNFKRNYHDAGKKHHLVKKFHHHSDAGGNNYERLNFNKKNYRDNFAQNAKADHSNANKAARNYYKNAANAAAYHDDKQAYDNGKDAFNHYNAANAARGNAAKKSNYYNRNAARADGARNDAAKAAYNKHNNAASAAAYKLNDYVNRQHGNNGHAYKAANGGAANYGNGAHNTGVGYGNRALGLINGVVGLNRGVVGLNRGVVGLNRGGKYGLNYRANNRVYGLNKGVVGLSHGSNKGVYGLNRGVVGLGQGVRGLTGYGRGVNSGYKNYVGYNRNPYFA